MPESPRSMDARHLSRSVAITLLVVLASAVSSRTFAASTEDRGITEAMRHAALGDLFVLQDYRAGKNSFVESPERHPGHWTGVGYRRTLLDVQGTGSLRHIWTTRGEGDPYFDWEFYVDGESEPSLKGTDVDLIHAAERYPLQVAPANSVPLGNRDFNWFLPIPFSTALRVDVVQRQPSFWLWFCQIDYRLEDSSLSGARLYGRGTGEDLRLNYVGLPSVPRTANARQSPLTEMALSEITIPAGGKKVLAQMSGPGIVRELRLRWDKPATARLSVRYDGAETDAISSPIEEFFGPFQGVSFFRHGAQEASCYLPMPFRDSCQIAIENTGDTEIRLSGAVSLERVPQFAPGWGYLHALHQRTAKTDGHRLHQVLYVRGRGHWVGMTLYRTGHDHGGGDFAVIDGEGLHPAFLHGVNGEDYFTFAWFGRGAHHPYAVAHTNDEGRYRHHFENVYPFKNSIAIEWGAFADLSPESVAVWYQDSPEDTTVPDGARKDSVQWDVFGPVPITQTTPEGTDPDLFAGLPSVAALDAGQRFECVLIEEKFTSGWNREWSTGPSLNLTYLGRHGTPIGYEAELGGAGHAMLARRFIESDATREVTCWFAHDDPIEVWVNGNRVYREMKQLNGFEATRFTLPVKAGRNEVVVRLTHYFNRNFNWAGFWMRTPEPEF